MKLKRSIQKTFGSTKVKSVQIHPTKAIGFAGLFDGQVQVWDMERMAHVDSVHVCSEPIRTCVILRKMDWILIGSDDGCVTVYELGKYRKIKSFQAHSDFIRKIEGHPEKPMFVTASDDTTMKMWVYENGINQSMTYTGHGHFVMDVCFYPQDSSKFISCSLDSTIKMWSVEKPHCIRTFKGHSSGVNSICFVNEGYLVSGADDLTLKVWDFQTGQCVSTLTGHTNNINKVYMLNSFPLFASCSEDGSVRLWNSKTFKQEDMLALQGGRVWDIKERDGMMMIGCDEELIFVGAQQMSSLAGMSNGRIFYCVGNSVYGSRSDSVGVKKMISSLDFCPDELDVSPGGKMIALGNEGEYKVYSSLGFRSKYSGEGRDFQFIDEEEYVVRNGSIVNFYKKAEVLRSLEIQGISKLFYLTPKLFGANVMEHTVIYSMSGRPVCQIEGISSHLVVIGDFLIACGAAIEVYKINHEMIEGFEELDIEVTDEMMTEVFEHVCSEYYTVSSCCVDNEVLYFVSCMKGYYMIVGEKPYVYHFSSIEGILAGVEGEDVFYLQDKLIEIRKVDGRFMEFQKAILQGNAIEVSDGIRSRAIVFFESLGMHEEALRLCMDDNQRFEILLKLNRYDEAFNKANSIAKYEKLGRYFLKNGELEKASDCFFKSKNWVSVLLTDTLSGKINLSAVGDECKREGRLNHAFFAYLKSERYGECARLLEGTAFSALFAKNYLD
ncbi:WD40 domain-containing protein [Ordospora colligata]|nr:WD40 domain-containing protein [Ordospora colligata]